MTRGIPDNLYAKMDMVELLKMTSFDSSQWLKWFTVFSKNNSSNLKLLRQQVQQGTLKAFRTLKFQPQNSSSFVSIDKNEVVNSATQCQYFSNSLAEKTITECKSSKKAFTTKVSIMKGDCIEAALLLSNSIDTDSSSSSSRRVAVLNMTSARRPGGGMFQILYTNSKN